MLTNNINWIIVSMQYCVYGTSSKELIKLNDLSKRYLSNVLYYYYYVAKLSVACRGIFNGKGCYRITV
jgi:hypothetical protein